MKRIHPLLLVPLLSLVMAGFAHSQTAVPSLMNYQAHVEGTSGAIGDPAPVNRLVHFKFWKSPTSSAPADLLYSESQTVTVNAGDFSVLIGNGGTIGSEPHVFANAFNSTDLHLGITVDFDGNGSVANDTEITPRQQIVSTAFAMRAKVAEGVDAGAITETMLGAGAVTANKLGAGAVTFEKMFLGAIKGGNDADSNTANRGSILDGSITSFDLADNAVTLAKMADNSVGAAEIVNGSVTNSKLGTDSVSLEKMANDSVGTNEIINANVTASKLASTVGVFTKSGNNLSHTAGTVAIGNSGLSTPLQITGNISHALQINSPATGGYGLRHTNGTNAFRTWVSGIQTNLESTEDMYLVTDGFARLAVTKGGRIGIGTQAPTRGKVEIVGSEGSFNLLAGFGLLTADVVSTNGAGNHPTDPSSLFCDGGIKASEFIAPSDNRIKTITGRSNAAQDLKVLQSIEVTDYTYIDKALKGGREYKKVIAQQVEAVYPQAVQRGTDIVPDIYQKAGAVDGWVKLATDLQKGERVRLVHAGGDDVHEILDVAADRFRADLPSGVEQVFVYGREVKDFRNVDYEAIAMLNVSATQELARKLEVKDAEIKALREKVAGLAVAQKRLAELEARDQARDAKLAAIEKLLLSTGKPAVRTVSLKQGGGAE